MTHYHTQLHLIYFFHSFKHKFRFINCYLPFGKTSIKTTQRIKAIENIIFLTNKLYFRQRKIIIAGNFNLVVNPVSRIGHYSPTQLIKLFFDN